MRTYDQKMAEKAFECVLNKVDNEEYASFAKSFPSLIHYCGLAQAVSFAEAKKRRDYLIDLNMILNAAQEGVIDLPKESRDAEIADYIRLSRHAVSAASWLKRYVQAFGKEA